MSRVPAGSPSLLNNLHLFGYKQKPALSHRNDTESVKNVQISGSNTVKKDNHVITISSSDSESESNVSKCTNSSPVRPNRFPVMTLSSDSESEVTRYSGDTSPVQRSKFPVMTISSSSDSEPDADKIASVSNVQASNCDVPGTTGSMSENQDELQNGDTVTPKRIKRKRMKVNKNAEKRKKRGSGNDWGEDYSRRSIYNSDDDDNNDDESEDDGHRDVSGSVSRRRRLVVRLLDEGTEDDLRAINGITENKVAIIQKHRPFASWKHVVATFNHARGLSSSMLNTIDNTILAKEVVSDLMKKCEKVAIKTEQLIASKGTLVTKKPALLNPNLNLASYQMVGLNWLAIMHSQSLNTILADEMGLGKTIQTIAFLAYLKEIGNSVPDIPHLIVVPASTLTNWEEELEKWCPSLKVAIYHGSQEERRCLRYEWGKHGFGDLDVILTSYSCTSKSYEEKRLFKTKEFHYIIYDEAHMLKNMNSQRYSALAQFNGNYKILLTGTPLQNNLLELMSLLMFLIPDFFESKTYYIKLLFSKKGAPMRGAFEQEKIEQAKRIMEPFILRRLKADVLNDLPQKNSELVKCPMVAEQAKRYQMLIEECKQSAGSTDGDKCMTYYMMMRKLANHPLLLRHIFTEEKLQLMAEKLATDAEYKGTVIEHIVDDLWYKSDYELHLMSQNYKSLNNLKLELPPEEIQKSGKFEKIGPLLKNLKSEGHKVLIFSQFLQMLDILEEFCDINGYLYLRLDGSTPVVERQWMIDTFNNDDEKFIFLLSTKAGGLGINLTAADTVIIHDIDFNPYNDKQAEDRCHRVGQTKSVKVYKLISEGTIEERIYEIAQQKLHLEKEVTSVNEDEMAETRSVLQLLKETLGI